MLPRTPLRVALFALLAVFLCVPPARAQQTQPPAEIRYHFGDESDGKLGWANPNFDDSAWPIAKDGSWPTPPIDSDGFVWVRYHIPSPELAAGIHRVKGIRKLGSRLGNWITAGEAAALWQIPDGQTLTGKRNRAILAILLGCGLRRRELAELTLESLQRREERWAIVDLVGKGRHIRTVPVPNWVKETLDAWLIAAGIETGPLFRCVCRAGKPWGNCISEKTVWHVVKKTAASMNIPRLAPHDLRRSCARFCHDSGGELEQIQFLLGHVSVQTTERYIGCKQRLRLAVNDRLGIEPG